MALINKLRSGNFAQKRGLCLAAIAVQEGLATGTAAEIPAGVNDEYQVVNLPENAIIQNAYVFVKTASDAVTTAIATLGTTEGGSEILSAGNLKALGKQGTFTGETDTGSGVTVYLGVTYTGAATNVGDYVIVIEYLEYNKTTGEYTLVTV